mmetsp:Transcript_20507/g.31213  ORF Transcript_20507/g.31213 Transcript_20507/m.31213 type:complete len:122 (+) Transcript_20507:871-1236(+)
MLMMFSLLLTIDVIMLVSLLIDIFMVEDGVMGNFTSFGWAFLFIYFAVPVIAPMLTFMAAITRDPYMMKEMGNLNAICISVNIPLAMGACLLMNDDPAYVLSLLFYMMIKILVATVSAKIR